jgi:hypothetical protein
MPPGVGVGGDGVGGDGVCGAGAGFGVRFLVFALLADFALFVPFFVRAEVRRFAFLSFLAMFNLQISQSKLCQHGTKSQPLNNLCTTVKNKGDLQILVEDDRRLFNQYGVMLVNPGKHPNVKGEFGQAFIDWLVSPEAQRAIADFKINGEQLYYPNATDPDA